MKRRILTLLTAFVLLSSSFTFSSCKDCGKKEPEAIGRGGKTSTEGDSETISGGSGTTSNSNGSDKSGENQDLGGSLGLTQERLLTLSSCKRCGKDRDGDTPLGDDIATLDAGNDKSKTMDVGTGVEELEADVFRMVELAEKAKQEEQNAKNAAKRGWDAALVKVVVDVSNKNKVKETQTAKAKADLALKTVRACKDMAKQLAEIEKVWDIKETDDMGRWRKETIKNAVLETVEAFANAERWADVAGKATYSAENVDVRNADAGVGARACWAANDAATDAGVAKGNARYAADQVTAAVKTYGDAVAAIASEGADGQDAWEAIIDVKYNVALVKAAYVATKYYADMANAFVDKAKERNVRVVWENGDKVALAQEHVKEAAEHMEKADKCSQKVLKSIIL